MCYTVYYYHAGGAVIGPPVCDTIVHFFGEQWRTNYCGEIILSDGRSNLTAECRTNGPAHCGYTEDPQPIRCPAKDVACEMTSLMVEVKKLNTVFNTAFPQLVEDCSA